MVSVVPTVNAANVNQYKEMLDRVSSFTKRVHVDVCDGKFADGHTPGLAQMYAPEDILLDLHLMLQKPENQFNNAVSLKPHLIIYHFESSGNIMELIQQTHTLGIKAGLAILPQTPISIAANLIKNIDHVLIFTGTLGHNGGIFEEGQLIKVAEVRHLSPTVEISVDGGVSADNAHAIAAAGVNVLYAGSYIQSSDNSVKAYETLVAAAESGLQ